MSTEAATKVVGQTRRKPSLPVRLATMLALAVMCLASLQVSVAQELDMDAILAASPTPQPTAGATGFHFGIVLLYGVLSILLSSYCLLHNEFGWFKEPENMNHKSQ
jgi:uncharacterized oligopeptide transporter (OPT) family protein